MLSNTCIIPTVSHGLVQLKHWVLALLIVKGKCSIIYLTLPQKQLTDDEKKILCGGLNINPENKITGVTGDVEVAFMQVSMS